ncbi:Methyltransferase domain-containing protein [Pseudonocardia thermophila]|uniref:Methyltransferase domain-containing protein n=1 Tax=Pseudonocardia thermophila TaxID=1848 RepID=A0A1M6NS25_PSETH|nr:class I SAM-dependent methyltransferase [Pseudonocardia thermophila]SHJ98362.1 Methyltransferase domain-containing protein [Pseudonocardia thermophila]
MSGRPDAPGPRAVVPAGARAVRGWLYDTFVAGLTAQWYRVVLDRLPDGARMLDVGIGTGAALARCAETVERKDLHVVGLDIDPDYLQRCRRELARAGLAHRVKPLLQSVYDHAGGPYDAVYFSASLMLLPDPAGAIAHVARLLAPGGRVYATQTFHHRRSRLLEWGKPVLRHVTTIDFGHVTYEPEFRAAFAAAGVPLVELSVIRGGRFQSYRLAVAEPGALARSA